MLCKMLPKTKREEFLISCDETNNSNTKPDKDDNQKSKLYANFTYEYQCKNFT